MSSPQISVAIATYNGEQHLETQLRSIYSQTLRAAEVVVSDDCSSDQTVAILERFAASDGLRYTVGKERRGLVANFAKALSMARGDYVAISDQDDIWKPEKLATLLQAIGSGSLAYCSSREILDLDGQVHDTHRFERFEELAKRRSGTCPVRELLTENWVVGHQMLLSRRAIARALPFATAQPFHDGWLALCAALTGPIAFVARPLQTYRRHRASVTFREIEAVPSSARFPLSWRTLAQREIARLRGVRDAAVLPEAAEAYRQRLETYYRAGVETGWRWRSFRASFAVAPYFSTARGIRDRWKISLRPLLGGL